MNKKSLIIIIIAAVIVIAAGAGFALTRDGGNDKAATASETVQTSEAQTSAQTDTTQNETTIQQATSESSTAPSSTKDEYAFVKSGVWFYYDDTKHEAYAFEFKDDDDVKITYFNSDNVDGEDAQFASGEADYKISNGKITIDDIPDTIDAKEFTFSASKNKITSSDGTQLENKDRASLDYAYNHFNK